MQYISSQLDRVQEIVAAKLAAEDYEVQYVELVIDGEAYRVVVDGHHSHEAAMQAGAEPEYVESSLQREYGQMDPNDAMDALYIDCQWYDINTQMPVW